MLGKNCNACLKMGLKRIGINILEAKPRKRRFFEKKPYQRKIMVEVIGFEPMTPCLQSRCSSQLS
jgi:hypothetical protein